MKSNDLRGLLPLTLARTRELQESERLRISLSALQEQENSSFDTRTLEAKKTAYFRDKVWSKWMQWVEDVGFDNAQHWLDFCLGKESAKQKCRGFIISYINQSYVERPCLGPEEWTRVRTLNSAICIRDVWVALLRRVDENILSKKREASGENRWRVLFSSKTSDYFDSPGAMMVKWITFYCESVNMLTQQSFIKRELQEEDVVLILSVLWLRGEHIRCTPTTRLAFHSAVLLAAIGGFRPASLMDLPYSNVQLYWHRHPKTPSKTSLTAAITINHVKQRRHQIEQHQRSSLTFHVGFAPCKQICLLSCLVARALRDNAFDAGFSTLDELLGGSVETDIETIPLKWNKSMLKKPIIPISYTSYWKQWTQTLYVAGLRNDDHLRPYALRVTAGGKLDGTLTRAAANFIMSHGTAVFERSYQTPHISTDLMKIAFGGRAGDYEEQFARISSVFSRRDPFSPLYLTAQELAEFEKRQDISSLRLAYEDATKNNEQQAEELKSRIKYIIDYLEKLKLAEKRNEYFEAADDLRARGLSTAHLRQPGETNPKRQKEIPGCKASPVVGVLFQNNVDATQLVANLVLYLEGRLPAPKDMQHQPDSQTRLPKIRKTKIHTRKLCLICNITCATKATLSRHVERTHTFEEAFECPACRQTGHHVIVDAGAVQWAKHVEHQHGKQLAPDPFFSQKPAYCLICSTSHAIRGFSLHFSKAHEKESQYPFDCRECGQKGVVAKIQDRRSWIRHAMEVHGSKDPINGSVLEGEFDTVLQSKKRKRSVSVLDSDAGELSSRFPIGTGEDDEFWVTGRDSDYIESDN